MPVWTGRISAGGAAEAVVSPRAVGPVVLPPGGAVEPVVLGGRCVGPVGRGFGLGENFCGGVQPVGLSGRHGAVGPAGERFEPVDPSPRAAMTLANRPKNRRGPGIGPFCSRPIITIPLFDPVLDNRHSGTKKGPIGGRWDYEEGQSTSGTKRRNTSVGYGQLARPALYGPKLFGPPGKGPPSKYRFRGTAEGPQGLPRLVR